MDSTNKTYEEWLLFSTINKTDAEFAKNLLSSGVSPNAVDSEGEPALIRACQKNDVTIVKLLLLSGADIDSLVGGGTALMIAAREGFYDIVNLLLSSKPGADPNIQSNYNATALDVAVQQQHLSVVELLLANGANPKSEAFGLHLLTWVAKIGNVQIAEALIKRGANVNAVENGKAIFENRKVLNESGEYAGATALWIAAFKGHTEMVKLLLSHGADPSLYPRGERSAYLLAKNKGHTAVVELLQPYEENSLTGPNNEDTLTALGRLAGSGVQSIFRMVGGFIDGVTAPSQQAQSPEVARGVLKSPSDSEALSLLLDELNALAGLSNVKAEVKKHINLLRVQQMRLDKGLSVPEQSLHMVFYGNPGTGKTSIARLLAKIYKQMGILSKGQFVETDRTGLVAEYVGQTGPKVQSVVKKALGGVLFIDEAYTLTGNERSSDSFGQEAIDTLIKLMEDHRGDLIVIVAGYTEPMELFVQSNPGLRSRFNKYLQFDDYTPVDLSSIFQSLVKQHDYKLTDDARESVNVFFSYAYQNRTKAFGNARLARNLFETVVSNHALRIGSLTDPTDDELVTIAAEDI